MKVLLSWLREFAPFPDDIDALSIAMASLGLPVEEVERVGEPIAGIIVAKVLRRAPHPQADRIGLVFVDVGDGEELQICCGAFNMQPGDLVPLATIGTVMPDGRDIQRSKLRGEWSNGMLCSSTELGLGDDSAGILILPEELPIGSPLNEALGLEADVVFDLDVTRNRPDCWGHVGVARDLAAHLALPFSLPDVTSVDVAGPSDALTVEIQDRETCGRFTARRIDQVVVTASPPVIARRLERAGMRAINNVVDASNYVMLELNRPNHAYDENKLPGRGFIIRRAGEGEVLETLDGTARSLTAAHNLIADATGTAIGIGGIMGGANTEVNASTTTIALEQAWFDPVNISITVAQLGLRSEASARFERGVDPYDDDYAARRFVQILRLTSPEARLHGPVVAHGILPSTAPVVVRVSRTNAVLGTTIEREEIVRLLDPIGYAAVPLDADRLSVVIPTWRHDSTSEIDVIEEVARHHGYDRIVRTVPDSPHPGGLSEVQKRRRALRSTLVGLGATEVMPLPFLAPGDLDAAGVDTASIAIANPLVADESVLRTSLLPGILKVIAYNANRRRTGISVFEVGHVFRTPSPGELLPDEREIVALARSGRDAAEAVRDLRLVAGSLGLNIELDNDAVGGLHPTRSAMIRSGSEVIGAVGEVDPAVLERFGVDERVAWVEIDLTAVWAMAPRPVEYRVVPRTPSNDIDLAFVVADAISAEDIRGTIAAAAAPLASRVELFDVYRGPSVGAGVRSLAFALSLQAPDRTVSDDEVAAVRLRCIEAVAALGGALRG